MGKALRDGYRDSVFLMTKIDGRSQKEATRQLDESLQRLQTDRIDLVQHHEIIRYEDPHRIFDEEGAHGGAGRGAAGGQDPLHRLHRAQGPAHPPAHAGGRAGARLHVRRRADAAQRDGRALPQLREAGAARAGEAGHRRAGDEDAGATASSSSRGTVTRRSSACTTRCNLPTSVVITGMRQHGDPRAGVRGGAHVPPDERGRGRRRCWRKTANAAAHGEFELFKTSSILSDSTRGEPGVAG